MAQDEKTTTPAPGPERAKLNRELAQGINSLKKGKTWYSPNRGFAELREEIAAYYKRRFGIEYDAHEMYNDYVLIGTSHVINGTMWARYK